MISIRPTQRNAVAANFSMANFLVQENGEPSKGYSNYLNVGGTINYFLLIELRRKPGTTNSSIQVKAFTAPDMAKQVAISLHWAHTTATPHPKYTPIAFQGETYHLSPLGNKWPDPELNKYLELKITPKQANMSGECILSYGPITLDKGVQQQLLDCIKKQYLEVSCDGTSTNSNGKRFDVLKATKHEIQLVDRYENEVVDKMPIGKDTMASPSYQDSFLVSISNPGNSKPPPDPRYLPASHQS